MNGRSKLAKCCWRVRQSGRSGAVTTLCQQSLLNNEPATPRREQTTKRKFTQVLSRQAHGLSRGAWLSVAQANSTRHHDTTPTEHPQKPSQSVSQSRTKRTRRKTRKLGRKGGKDRARTEQKRNTPPSRDKKQEAGSEKECSLRGKSTPGRKEGSNRGASEEVFATPHTRTTLWGMNSRN